MEHMINNINATNFTAFLNIVKIPFSILLKNKELTKNKRYSKSGTRNQRLHEGIIFLDLR